MMGVKKIILIFLILVTACSQPTDESQRSVIDFNSGWKFKLLNSDDAATIEFDDSNWAALSVPHDWSILEGYQQSDTTASSTGFVPGGIGWYRKHFTLNASDKDKKIAIVFDGVYNNSTVWINGEKMGFRPYGYSTFAYDLTDHLKFDGSENVVAVKVDRSTFVDSRWYTGSGIYRKVQLIKTDKLHIPLWGVQISTMSSDKDKAELRIKTALEIPSQDSDDIWVKYTIVDAHNKEVSSLDVDLNKDNLKLLSTTMTIDTPNLWGVDNPYLYRLKVEVFKGEDLVDKVIESFGIRSFDFDANTGFSLNGKRMKIKGVNLHHDAGALGAAVPKGIWEYRIDQLKSIGVNAIRMAHNPHSVELMEVCDEKGILVMAEAFDEWHVPKGKNLVYIGDNAAKGDIAKSYPSHFKEWAERDLKDLILRDYNHPSVIMWSIGNEIEWTFPHYSKTYKEVNSASGSQGYEYVANYDPETIRAAFEKNIESVDPLAATARQLVSWVKEIDTTRPVTCGSVLPSIGMVSGYGTAVDVFGFNYRASEYDAAHKQYPDLKIIGSENWGSYHEWKSIEERDFVSGIFVWTGFAYLGEAGPWPRKGLNISLFDFAGFKTPRGHFYECLWTAQPKVYMVTTPEAASEFSYDEQEGWTFDMQLSAPPVWEMLRKWEWYKVYPKWKYEQNESIVVQVYTNCEEAELFLNQVSLGKQKLSDYLESDHILKWLVPYAEGELKVVGFQNGKKVTEYALNTNTSKASSIVLQASKKVLRADGRDVTVVSARLLDENGYQVIEGDEEISFEIQGPAKNIGVDNGWEMNIQPHNSNKVVTHNGNASIVLQTFAEAGTIKIIVKNNAGIQAVLELVSES